VDGMGVRVVFLRERVGTLLALHMNGQVLPPRMGKPTNVSRLTTIPASHLVYLWKGVLAHA
jgi:hypothetical protein